MFDPDYRCIKCGWKKYENWDKMICPQCGGDLRPTHNIGLLGTRDGFGIKNAFMDKKTGKVIDNFRTWEKAGYRDPNDAPYLRSIRNEIKRKREKIMKYDRGKKTHIGGK